MEPEIKLDASYKPTDDIVIREVMGKTLIIPLTAGVGDMEDTIFSLNESGKAILDKVITGLKIRDVINSLAEEYDAEKKEVEADVTGIMKELVQRKILEEIKP